MSCFRTFGGNKSGASAAEFALILPVFLIFLLGTIDAGRYAWEFNRAAKATQVGARWAVVTDPIPGGDADDGLKKYSFSIDGGLANGSIVPAANFPGVVCTSAAGVASCECKTGGTCDFSTTVDSDAQDDWDALLNRMRAMYPAIESDNLQIDYDWSGLGFAGDPNGPDVAPLTTVTLRNMEFQPLTFYLFGGTIGIPESSYSLTLEDGDGEYSN